MKRIDEILLNHKHLLVSGLFLILSFDVAYSQIPVKKFDPTLFDTTDYYKYGNKKVIPPEIRKQVLISLSYFPELIETEVEFRFKDQLTPLSTKPSFLTLFKGKGKTTFVITISKKTSPKLTPILFFNMPFNAQIGVIGHELCHVSDFSKRNFWQFCLIAVGHCSGKYIDKMEFTTDSLCILHGLGFQLLSWSEFVREGLKIEKWLGATNSDTYHPKKNEPERYMNPVTILQRLKQCELYKSLY